MVTPIGTAPVAEIFMLPAAEASDFGLQYLTIHRLFVFLLISSLTVITIIDIFTFNTGGQHHRQADLQVSSKVFLESGVWTGNDSPLPSRIILTRGNKPLGNWPRIGMSVLSAAKGISTPVHVRIWWRNFISNLEVRLELLGPGAPSLEEELQVNWLKWLGHVWITPTLLMAAGVGWTILRDGHSMLGQRRKVIFISEVTRVFVCVCVCVCMYVCMQLDYRDLPSGVWRLLVICLNIAVIGVLAFEILHLRCSSSTCYCLVSPSPFLVCFSSFEQTISWDGNRTQNMFFQS